MSVPATMNSRLPVLYSFRRCPYAIRARMAIVASAVTVELREVVLKNKPSEMLALSPKGTVPVLHLSLSSSETANEEVIDESLDIMLWALGKNDPDDYLLKQQFTVQSFAMALIEENDQDFKPWLDRYKYADRYPEQSAEYYRKKAQNFLKKLDSILERQAFLAGETISIADLAIMPFIRQFAYVNIRWFESSHYPFLQKWLSSLMESTVFNAVMDKHPPWKNGDSVLRFPL